MDYYAARQQHIEWLQEQLAQEEAKLAEAQALVIQLQGSITYYKQAIESSTPSSSKSPSVGNSQESDSSSVENPKGRETCEKLNLLEGSKSQPENDLSPGQRVPILIAQQLTGEYYNSTQEDASQGSEGNTNFYLEREGGSERKPKDMLLPQYKQEGRTLGDVVEDLLRANDDKALGPDFLAKQMFEVVDNDEFLRAKNSLSTELRRGAKEGRWRKIGRGTFRANPVSFQSEQRMDIEEGNGFLGYKPLPL